jgi:hypothetical protein
MRAIVHWLMKPVLLLGVLALPSTGCSQQSNTSTADATTSSSTTPGPTAFVAEARAMAFGTKDLAAASESDLLRLGNVVCHGLGIEGLGFSRVVQRLVRSEARPTATEARALVRSAVRNLAHSMPTPSADVGRYPAGTHLPAGRGVQRSRPVRTTCRSARQTAATCLALRWLLPGLRVVGLPEGAG